MNTIRHPQIHFRRFRPAELERLTGLTPAGVRDWRRRKLIHASYEKEEGGFHPLTIAAFLFLKHMSDHGMGPKRFFGWESSFANMILRHAMADAGMWETADAWAAYQAEQEGHSIHLRKYLVIRTAPGGYALVNEPSDAPAPRREVETVVDLATMGFDLRQRFNGAIGYVTFLEANNI